MLLEPSWEAPAGPPASLLHTFQGTFGGASCEVPQRLSVRSSKFAPSLRTVSGWSSGDRVGEAPGPHPASLRVPLLLPIGPPLVLQLAPRLLPQLLPLHGVLFLLHFVFRFCRASWTHRQNRSFVALTRTVPLHGWKSVQTLRKHVGKMVR